jgi:hypothetical protein
MQRLRAETCSRCSTSCCGGPVVKKLPRAIRRSIGIRQKWVCMAGHDWGLERLPESAYTPAGPPGARGRVRPASGSDAVGGGRHRTAQHARPHRPKRHFGRSAEHPNGAGSHDVGSHGLDSHGFHARAPDSDRADGLRAQAAAPADPDRCHAIGSNSHPFIASRGSERQDAVRLYRSVRGPEHGLVRGRNFIRVGRLVIPVIGPVVRCGRVLRRRESRRIATRRLAGLSRPHGSGYVAARNEPRHRLRHHLSSR